MHSSTFFPNLLFILFFPFLSHSVTLTPGNTLEHDYFVGADRLAIADGYAYLASTQTAASGVYDYLTLVKLDDMTIAGRLTGNKLANTPAIAVSGNYAYIVSAYNSELVIVDVTDKTNPVFHGTPLSNNTFASAHSITVLGDHAYISSNNANNPIVSVVSIADTANPSLVTTVHAAFTPTVVNAADNKLFIGGSSNQLAILDVSTPGTPQSLTTLNGPSDCSYKKASGILSNVVALLRQEVYMVSNYHSLVALSFAHGSAGPGPDESSCLENDDMQEVILGHVDGSYLFIVAADINDAWRVLPIDVTNPASLAIVTEFAISIEGIPLAVGGSAQKLYVLKDPNKLTEITIVPVDSTSSTTTTTTTPTTTTTAVNATTTTTEETNANSNDSTESVQGTTTWWLIVLISTCGMCFCVPCCAYVNMKYIRPVRIARLERKREAAKVRKHQETGGAGSWVVEDEEEDNGGWE